MSSFPSNYNSPNDKKSTLLETSIVSFNQSAMESLHGKNFTAAKSLLHRSLEMLKVAEASESVFKLKSVTLNNLGILYKCMQDYEKALFYLSSALEIGKLLKNDEQNKAGTHLNMCAIQAEINQHEKALQHAMMAVQILLRAGNEHSKSLIVAYHSAGIEYQLLGFPLKAVQCFERGYNIAIDTLGQYNQLTISLENALKDYHGYKAKARQKSTDFYVSDRLGSESQSIKFDTTPWRSPQKPITPLKNSFKSPYKAPVVSKNRPLDYSFFKSPEKIDTRKYVQDEVSYRVREIIGKNSKQVPKITTRNVVSDMRVTEKPIDEDSERIFDKFKEDTRKSEMQNRHSKQHLDEDYDYYDNEMWDEIKEEEEDVLSKHSESDIRGEDAYEERRIDNKNAKRLKFLKNRRIEQGYKKKDKNKDDRSLTEMRGVKKSEKKRKDVVSEDESSEDFDEDERRKQREKKYHRENDKEKGKGKGKRKESLDSGSSYEERKKNRRNDKYIDSTKREKNDEQDVGKKYKSRNRKEKRNQEYDENWKEGRDRSESSENMGKYIKKHKKDSESSESHREDHKRKGMSPRKDRKSHSKIGKSKEYLDKNRRRKKESPAEDEKYKSKREKESYKDLNRHAKLSEKNSQTKVSKRKNYENVSSDTSNQEKSYENYKKSSKIRAKLIKKTNSSSSEDYKNPSIPLPSVSIISKKSSGPSSNLQTQLPPSSLKKKSKPSFQTNEFGQNPMSPSKKPKNPSDLKNFPKESEDDQGSYKVPDNETLQNDLKNHREISTQTLSELSSQAKTSNTSSLIAVREKNSLSMLKNSQKVLKNSQLMLRNSKKILKNFESYTKIYNKELSEDIERVVKEQEFEEKSEDDDMSEKIEESDVDKSQNSYKAESGYASDVEESDKKSIFNSEMSSIRHFEIREEEKKDIESVYSAKSGGQVGFAWNNSYKNKLKSKHKSPMLSEKASKFLEDKNELSSQAENEKFIEKNSVKSIGNTKNIQEKNEKSPERSIKTPKNKHESIQSNLYESKPSIDTPNPNSNTPKLNQTPKSSSKPAFINKNISDPNSPKNKHHFSPHQSDKSLSKFSINSLTPKQKLKKITDSNPNPSILEANIEKLTISKISNSDFKNNDSKNLLKQENDLKNIRNFNKNSSAVIIQKWMRMWLIRNKFLNIIENVVRIQKFWKGYKGKQNREKEKFRKQDFSQQFNEVMLVENKIVKDLAMQTENSTKSEVLVITKETI